jgi:hypothetical protein
MRTRRSSARRSKPDEASGAKVALFQVDLYRMREGLITEHRAGYQSRAAALEAVGLTDEQDSHVDS